MSVDTQTQGQSVTAAPVAPAIELIGVSKSFGPVQANKDINMTVAKGAIHGIVGENGAGKSTLMSILYGFYKADAGEIKIDGVTTEITDSHAAIAAGIGAHIDAADVGLERKAVGHHAAIAYLADHRLHFGMVDAQDRRAVEGDVVDEFDEGVFHPVEIAVMVEMLGVDIGDHRDGPVEPEEAAVALVGLHHHPVAIAQSRVRTVWFDDAAIDDGGIDIAAIEQCGDHAGGRCLAMRPRHRDGGFQPHQFGQHFRAAHHGDAVFEREGDFGIGALHRGGSDDDRRAHHVFRRMADCDPDPARTQALDHRAFLDVRSLHAVAEIGHHFGDAGHADPAYADEMDGADIGGHASHGFDLSCMSRAAPCPAATPCEAPRALFAPTRITSIISAPPKLSTRSARS